MHSELKKGQCLANVYTMSHVLFNLVIPVEWFVPPLYHRNHLTLWVVCLQLRAMAFRAILVFLPTLLGIALSQSPGFYGNSLSFMSPQKKKDGTVQVGFGISQCPTRLWEAKQKELFATLTNRQMAKLTMYCMYNRSNSNSYTVCFTTNYWNRYMI